MTTNREEMKLIIQSDPSNEGFARATVASFATRLNPTIAQISEIKTVVSEAVTNSIIHGYRNTRGIIEITTAIVGSEITIQVEDFGCGIEDIDKAKEPFYTSLPEQERAGLGFAVMESLSDSMQVVSAPGQGTRIVMRKDLAASEREVTGLGSQQAT